MYKPVSEEDDHVDMTMSTKEDDEDSITSFPSLNNEELSDEKEEVIVDSDDDIWLREVKEEVKKILFTGETYLQDKSSFDVYNMEQELVGFWNEETGEIDFFEEEEDDEDDD